MPGFSLLLWKEKRLIGTMNKVPAKADGKRHVRCNDFGSIRAQGKENAMRRIFVGIVAVGMVCNASALLSDKCNQETWVTNGPVNTILPSGDKIYIGGDFTQVGPYGGSGVTVDASTGKIVLPFAKIDYLVSSACSDGKGGWFVCGSFARINGIPRREIAHLKHEGTLDAGWNPDPDSTVTALALCGNKLYVGGCFTTIGGQKRTGLAALDATTGKTLDWNAEWGSVGEVRTILADGPTVYAGGYNGSWLAQSERRHVVAFDSGSGVMLNWNPRVFGEVLAIAKIGSTVFIGGDFDTVGKTEHRRLAAVNAQSGEALDWNWNIDSRGVECLAAIGTTLFVGGHFESFGGERRNNLAALDATSGRVLSWKPDPNNQVGTMVADSANVYVGGLFDTIGATPRFKIASFDAAAGKLRDWDPMVFGGGDLHTIALSGQTIFIGGVIMGVGAEWRKNLAAIDAVTGKALPWNPQADRTVNALAASGGAIFAGGEFDSVGGQPRAFIASIDTAQGMLLPWNPRPNGRVFSIVSDSQTVFAGGWFDSIAGQFHGNVAALDAVTGNLLDRIPGADSAVRSLLLSGNVLYAGGDFSRFGEQQRRCVAAVDAVSGKVLDWKPNADGRVTALARCGSRIYAGGSFGRIGGRYCQSAAALDTAVGNAADWNVHPTYYGMCWYDKHCVTSFAEYGTDIFLGGYFSSIQGQYRYLIAALGRENDSCLSWNAHILQSANCDNFVSSIAMKGTSMYIGGSFSSMETGFNHPFFARFDTQEITSVKGSRFPPCDGKLPRLLNAGVSRSGFAGAVHLSYALPTACPVTVRLHTLTGRMITEAVDSRRDAGNHTLILRVGKAAAGIYLLSFRAGGVNEDRVITLLR
jgi:trimeric autotransporter adhesin